MAETLTALIPLIRGSFKSNSILLAVDYCRSLIPLIRGSFKSLFDGISAGQGLNPLDSKFLNSHSGSENRYNSL